MERKGGWAIEMMMNQNKKTEDHMRNLMMMMLILAAVLIWNNQAVRALENEAASSTDALSWPTLRGTVETGFLAVLDHRIQFGQDGTYFSYTRDGGQDVLFPFTRLSLDLRLSPRDTVVLLYQPLDLITRTTLRESIVVDKTTFTAGTPMEFRYSFPFYRISYLYDFIAEEADELALGLSLQIRNTSIEFLALNGDRLVRKSNIGPVPVIKVRGRHQYANGTWVAMEADGFYAPISYLNGSDNEVVGAILDASVRYGWTFGRDAQAFINLRYLGGGAVGTSTNEPAPSDGYTKNWLHFLTLSVGFNYTLRP